ncbi:MAG: hydroxyphenylacetyl-CoA thioesterase PaaI [Burkholderiaceae bacterium]
MNDRVHDNRTHAGQAVAEAVRDRMFNDDAASRALGMRVEAVGPGYSKLSMTIRPDMLNGFKTCHGGLIATLADSAFAFACNSHNEVTVASGIVVDFLAPAHEGDVLHAECREVALTGRTGVYDVTVTNQHGKSVVVMRGRSHTMKAKAVVHL